MRIVFASVMLWAFVLGTALILGAGLYEALVVMPFWSAHAPQSLAQGNPLLQVPIRSGRVFWSTLTPALGIIALATVITGLGTPQPHRIWRLGGAGLLLLVTVATLAYFRPSIIQMVVHHGAGSTSQQLAHQAKRWAALNWFRIAAVGLSLAMGVRALLLPVT